MCAVCSLGMFWTEHGQQANDGDCETPHSPRSVGAIPIPSKAHQGQQGEINMPSEGQGAEGANQRPGLLVQDVICWCWSPKRAECSTGLL